MKKNPLTAILVAVLVVSALASVVLCWAYISNTRQLRQLTTQVNAVQANERFVSALAGDALEYSKKNPAIEPILEAAGVRPLKTASASASKPATK
jgi:hypothetical protein